MVKKAVCLISGGIDSCVTSFIAKKKGYKIYALTFCYGQKHSKELDSAEKITKELNCVDHIFFNLDLKIFGGSSLLDEKLAIEQNIKLNRIGWKIPSTYVPARNTVFLSIALAYAETLNADAVFIGATSADYSGYPDCRPEFFKAFQKMADLATKKGVEKNSISIKTPLLNLNKEEIIKKGLELKVPFKNTWSCYQGEEKACGRCDSCLLRLKGFKKAKACDPIDYSYYPKWYK